MNMNINEVGGVSSLRSDGGQCLVCSAALVLQAVGCFSDAQPVEF